MGYEVSNCGNPVKKGQTFLFWEWCGWKGAESSPLEKFFTDRNERSSLHPSHYSQTKQITQTMPLTSEINAEINNTFVHHVPELDSDAARYPLMRAKWLLPFTDRVENDACYIAASSNDGIKKDYIYVEQHKRRGKVELPAGYYHLRTREGHAEAYRRFKQAAPKKLNVLQYQRLSTDEKNRIKQERELYQKAAGILHNRVVYEPNDVHSSRLKALNAQSAGSTAKAAGKAAYLPALTSAVLISLGTGAAGA